MRKILLLALVFVTSVTAFGQDFSNKGKEFWLCFPTHVPSSNNATLSIYITGDKASSGTITMPNGAFSGTFNIAANGIQEIPITWAANRHIDGPTESNIVLNKSIHIKTNTGQPPVVAYAQQWAGARSTATLLLPVNVLGTKYYSMNFAQDGVGGGRSQFQIIATKPNTVVQITPVKNGVKEATITVNLPQAGDLYQYWSATPGAASHDLTGTYIESVASGSGGCKPIAVSSGSSNIKFGTAVPNCAGSSYDPLWQQLYPVATWGKNFGFIPFADYLVRGNPYRVMASEDNTNVYFDGAYVATLNAGQIYPAAFSATPVTLLNPTSITADKPICVAQYAQSDGCSGQPGPANQRVGDPDMVILNPIEQNISDITVFSSTNQSISRQYANILMKTIAIPSFKISRNGGPLNPPTGTWQAFPSLPGFSYLRESLTGANSIRMVSDSGFNAIAYGWGNVESYAYSAGTNVRDLYQQIGVQTEYGIETTPSVCTNSPFRFKVSLPYCADSIRWDLSALPGPPSPPIDTIRYNTCVPTFPLPGGPDSTTIVNGRTLYWYSLPSLYTFSTIGTYPVSIITYSPNASGCGSEQLIDFDLQISDPPLPNFTWTPGGCVAEPFQFTETTPQVPKQTYKWWWNFGDPGSGVNNDTSILRNPIHLFSAPGTYTVRYGSITTPGCLSDTISKQVIVPDYPNATIAGNTAVCLNSVPTVPVTFTGSLGTAEYIFSYNINGGATQTTPPSTGGSYTINAPTNVAGPFTYNLVGVTNALPAGTPCARVITGQSTLVTINPLPTASVSGTISVCQNAPSPNITFTGAAGTAPYTFTYNINGGGNVTVTTVAGNSVTVPVPTNVVGTFSYNLVSVLDASSTLCSQAQGGSAVVTVNPLPTAGIAGTTSVCKNAASPLVTFTGADGTAPYTFTYNINGGANQTITTTSGNSVTIPAPTNVVGTFTYNLVSVLDASSTLCTQAQSGSAVITVNDLPTASIAGNITVCLNAPSPNITFTGANTSAPYTFSYTINSGPVQTVTTVSGNSVTVPVSTAVAGTFTYDLVSVQDGSSTFCSQAQTGSAVVIVKPLPTASIAGNTTVCLNAASPLVTFTGAVGTAPYTFTYNINGGANQTITTVAGNSVTIAAPTNVAGTFNYNLVSVQEGSTNTCSQAQAGSVVITVNDLPTASISGTTQVCLNAPSPDITFTGASTVAPYTFTYKINGGPNQTVSTIIGNSVTVPVPTGVAGTFTYTLVSVQDGSNTTCSQAQAGSAVVTVFPLPTAAFNYTTPTCDTRSITFTDNSAPNAGTFTGWAWDFGDPASGGNNTSAIQNPVHVFSAPNTAPGYNVRLTVTTSNGCSNAVPLSRIVVVNHRPVAGFIVPDVCINDVATVFTDTSKIASGTINRPLNQWNYGDPASGPLNNSVGVNGSHLYPAPGIYQVTQIVTSSLGCKDTIVLPITINSADPVSNFTAASSCSSDSVSLVNLSTVGFGNVTRLDIYWNTVGVPETIILPIFNGVYKHKYPTLQTTQTYNIRMIAYSGVICSNTLTKPVTVYATPRVQFNNIPSTCLLVAPFQLTQGSEIGGVPGTGTYSGPGITNPSGTFNPQLAGIGTHNIKYTWTASNPGACIDTLTRTITVLDTAHAKFSVVLPSCEQVPTSFTDLSTAPGSVIMNNTVWNFGDGSPNENHAPGSTFGHPFPGPGMYTVTMHTVSDGALACLSTDTSAVITIDANHHITLNAGSNNNQAVCVNTSIAPISYTLSGGATNVNFVPSLPAGLSYTVGGTPLTLTILGAPTSAAGFNFSVQTTGNTCQVATANINITVAPDHAISRRLTAGDSAQSVCVNTAIDDIKYDLGGGATGVILPIAGLPPGVSGSVSGNVLTISGTPTSTAGSPYNFTIQTTGNSCIKATTIGEIKVHPYPVPDFAFDKTSYCIPNANVLFINNTSPGSPINYTYEWAFGDGGVSTGAGPTHFYASEGPFNVVLKAKSTVLLNGGVTGCESSKTKLLDIIHPQPKADFVFSKPSVCVGDNVTITDATDNKDGLPNKWHWDLGDGSTTEVTNPVTHTYPDTVTYVITMYTVNSFGCNSDTINKLPLVGAPYKPFTVYPYPHVSAGIDKNVLEGGSVQLEATAYGIQPQFSWTPVEYLTDSKTLRPRVVNPKTDMTYRLTVIGKGGCQLSDDVFVKLLKFPVIANTFSPNGDGINDTWRIDFLNTYPDNRVQIFSRAGKLVFQSRGYNSPWDGTLKGKPLPFDTYYYIIEPGNGRDPITGYVTILK